MKQIYFFGGDLQLEANIKTPPEEIMRGLFRLLFRFIWELFNRNLVDQVGKCQKANAPQTALNCQMGALQAFPITPIII